MLSIKTTPRAPAAITVFTDHKLSSMVNTASDAITSGEKNASGTYRLVSDDTRGTARYRLFGCRRALNNPGVATAFTAAGSGLTFRTSITFSHAALMNFEEEKVDGGAPTSQ